MTARGPAHFVVPDRARAQWDALAEALETTGPAPCTAAPETFWPDRVGALTETARRLCADCPLLGPCGAYAEAADERDGVWAGIDRSRLTRRYARAPRTTPPTPTPGRTS